MVTPEEPHKNACVFGFCLLVFVFRVCKLWAAFTVFISLCKGSVLCCEFSASLPVGYYSRLLILVRSVSSPMLSYYIKQMGILTPDMLERIQACWLWSEWNKRTNTLYVAVFSESACWNQSQEWAAFAWKYKSQERFRIKVRRDKHHF